MFRPKASKTKPKIAQGKRQHEFDFLEYISRKDFEGAITILEFQRRELEYESNPALQKMRRKTSTSSGLTCSLTKLCLWLGYCHYHSQNYDAAFEIYDTLIDQLEEEEEEAPRKRVPKMSLEHLLLYQACCCYRLKDYKQAQEKLDEIHTPTEDLHTRLAFHLAHVLHDEDRLMACHSKLQDVVEDQLCLASVHFLRHDYQEAATVYKQVLRSHPNMLSCHFYLAMCYYKMDYYDVALEMLNVYMQAFPDSFLASNLKACCVFRLYDGDAAAEELERLKQKASEIEHQELVRHNMIVFQPIDKQAVHIFHPLVHVIPEALENMILYHLQAKEAQEAWNLIQDETPSTPQECILHGLVHLAMTKDTKSMMHLKKAREFFHMHGSSQSEADTIPGRQSMASFLFLNHQFEEAVRYLESIESYLKDNPAFLWNFGIALANIHEYKRAATILAKLVHSKVAEDFTFLSWYCRCLVANAQAQEAWELYLTHDHHAFSPALLKMIANEAYATKQYYIAAVAFNTLQGNEATPEIRQGFLGACVGCLKQTIQAHLSIEKLQHVVKLLAQEKQENPQLDYVHKTITKWIYNNQT